MINTNRIFASVVFLFSLIIYIATMAPTTSFWDTGEFIASCYTLGVPHPPGTPLYLLIGNVFSHTLFFIDDIGARVNLMSPIASALSVMMLYLIIVQMIKNWVKDEDNKYSYISVYCSALIGSLVFAFTDSQWFNAVESEVYGMSTFFTAMVIWLALKWAENRGSNGNVKYIILIAYLMGLAIGVHLLNLLAIPFIGLIVYFSITKDKINEFLIDNSIVYILGIISFAGFDILGVSSGGSLFLTLIVVSAAFFIRYIISLSQNKSKFNKTILFTSLKRISVFPISGIIFYIINNVIIKGFPSMIKYWDSPSRAALTTGESLTLVFIPIMLVILLISGLVFLSITEYKRRTYTGTIYNIFRVSIVSLFMIYIGFSTYSLIFIRANQNPNINENDPSDKISFIKYINREQYGAEHHNIDWYNILKYYLSSDGKDREYIEYESKGDSYDSKNKYISKDEYKDLRADKKSDYKKVNRKVDIDIQINSSHTGLNDSGNKQRWLKYRWNDKKYANPNSGQFDITKVSNKEILKFVKEYQIKEMYLRYFGWQFIGKEYDLENYSWSRENEVEGPRIEWQPSIQDNKALANVDWYRYGLPFAFIFGIIGFIYHFIRDPRKAFSTLILFLATGLAIILYLNQNDPQPRERDYAYVGSFLAFSIWIGVGCMAFFDLIKYGYHKLRDRLDTDIPKQSILIPISIFTVVLFIIMPLTYLIKDYKYHNRSGNYAALDYGYNLLVGCKKKSIIFTNGDNDTFPLWYSQEVEKNQQDVRVINLSLLNASWYIEQIYNNNADGTIDFDFDEPIINEKRKNQILGKASKLKAQYRSLASFMDIPILQNSDGDWYIDINNDKTYNTYSKQETIEIINNFEDPITATIYAYKRWDPASWALIEAGNFYYKLKTALDNPDGPNILKETIYKSSYNQIMNRLLNDAKKFIEDNGISLNTEQAKKMLSEQEFMEHLNYIKASKGENTIASYLDNFVQTGYAEFQPPSDKSTEIENKKSRWGMTPDNADGVHYPYYNIIGIPPLEFSINYKGNNLRINIPTLEKVMASVGFRVQDIMILKIIEDLADTDRAIYFATTVSNKSQVGLSDYLSSQGMVLELKSNPDRQDIDFDKMYKNMLEKYRFTNLNNKDVYYSPDNKRILQNYRILFLTLASGLKTERKAKVLKFMNDKMPSDVIEYPNDRPQIKFWAAKEYLAANMIGDWYRLMIDLVDSLNNFDLNIEMANYLNNLKINNLNSNSDIISFIESTPAKILNQNRSDINNRIDRNNFTKRYEPYFSPNVEIDPNESERDFQFFLSDDLALARALIEIGGKSKDIINAKQLIENLFFIYSARSYNLDVTNFLIQINQSVNNIGQDISNSDRELIINNILIQGVEDFDIPFNLDPKSTSPQDPYIAQFLIFLMEIYTKI